MLGAKGLESQPSRMIASVPCLARHFAVLEPFTLNDGHLPPSPVEPAVPRNVTGGSMQRTVSIHALKSHIKRIVHFTLDQPTANP